MGNRRLESVLQRVRDTWIAQAVNDVTDADLLRRFVQQRDAAAFELLLRRHERMVFGVCRRLMQDVAEVDDALWRDLSARFGATAVERLAETIGAIHREWVGPDAALLLEPRTAPRKRPKRGR